ncbi:MAG TPA: hypothetical protein VIQ04_01430 [Nitrososphaeraceae archaeon]|jgi:hypothetical protein
MSLIIIGLGILFLIIGYGIFPHSINNIPSDNELVTIPKIGHINIIDTNKYFVF